jgi:hypothetical protein
MRAWALALACVAALLCAALWLQRAPSAPSDEELDALVAAAAAEDADAAELQGAGGAAALPAEVLAEGGAAEGAAGAEGAGAGAESGPRRTANCVSTRVDPGVSERLAKRCGHYVARLPEWRERALGPDARTVVSFSQRSGLGDRLAGIVSQFHAALAGGARMETKWYSNEALTHSCLVDGIFLGVDPTDRNRGPQSREGQACASPSCNAARYGLPCRQTPQLNVSLVDPLKGIRACTSASLCNSLSADSMSRNQSGFSLVETVGCPMRLMFEVTELLQDWPVRWFADEQEHEGTVREFAAYLLSQRVIALHVREGDTKLLHNRDHPSETGHQEGKAWKCLTQVESDMAAADRRRAVGAEADTRPIKWLVASDTVGMRDWFLKMHPQRLIMLLEPPVHIDLSRKTNQTASTMNMNTFAEWYAISLARELVSSTSGFWTTRPSAFSESAWLWSLRDEHYKLLIGSRGGSKGGCYRTAFKYTGAFPNSNGVCRGNLKRYTKAHKLRYE